MEDAQNQPIEEKQGKALPLIMPAVIVSLVFGIVFGALVFGAAFKTAASNTTSNASQLSAFVVLPQNNVGEKTVAFLNENLLKSQGVEAKLKEVKPFGNALYSVGVDLFKGNEKLQSTSVYCTQDGNLLILGNVLNLNENLPEQPEQQTAKLSCNDVKKAETARLEAFVVSYCPFGLQMQRVLAPIAKEPLGASIKVRYLGSIENGKITAMHGDKEAQENLRQICIREEQPSKYWQYVSEFIKKDDSEAALAAAKIDEQKLSACLADAARGLAFAQQDFDLADKYNAGGSPTLILNGTAVSEFDFAAGQSVSSESARSADNIKNLFCCGFNSKPSACSAQLATDSAATSFSEQYSTSGQSTAAASCG